MEEQEIIVTVPRSRLFITIPIMLCAIVGAFSLGIYFDLFGEEFDFVSRPVSYLFVSCFLFGLFGVIHTFVSAGKAAIGTIVGTCIFLLLYLAGKLSRGEL